MRIRTKLGIIELVIVVGFFLALGVMLFFTDSIIKLKNFEIASNNVMSSLQEVNYRTGSLLTTRAPIIQVSVHWTNSLTRFEQDLTNLRDYSDLRILSPSQRKQLDEATGWWNQIYEWYYRPAIGQLQKMVRSEAGEAVGTNGILQTLIEIRNQPGDPPEFIGELLTMQNYQDLIIRETATFSDRMAALTRSIQDRARENVRTSAWIVMLLLLVTLSITIFITARFGHLMSRRIRQVELAIRNIAQGDFSTELHINSKDELEELSLNYNILKNQLREKLNSVLGFMISISSTLPEDPDLNSILKMIAQSARENTGADGAAVYLLGAEDLTLHPRAFDGVFSPPFPVPEEYSGTLESAMDYAQKHSIPLGEHVIGRSVNEARPVFLKNVEETGRETGCSHAVEEALCISSLIVTPLMISTRLLGAVVTVNQGNKKGFTDLDFTHMQTFADYAALTIDNIFNYEELAEKREMHREIEIAADIQKNLLPGRLPGFPGIQMSAFSTAARGISGDYYDAFRIDKNRIGMVICDVVGKGVPASLLMVMIRTIIRLVVSPHRSPAQLLTLLNRGIIGRIGTEHFATMGILFYHRESRKITYSNAAHPPLLVYRPSLGKFSEIDTPGLPIGIERKEQYQNKSFSVNPGDVLVLYTDGIPETRSPEGSEYGEETLRKILRQSSGASAKEIIRRIGKDLKSFTNEAEQHDDQTMIIMKISG